MNIHVNMEGSDGHHFLALQVTSDSPQSHAAEVQGTGTLEVRAYKLAGCLCVREAAHVLNNLLNSVQSSDQVCVGFFWLGSYKEESILDMRQIWRLRNQHCLTTQAGEAGFSPYYLNYVHY